MTGGARFCFKGLSHEHSWLFVQTAWRMQLQLVGVFQARAGTFQTHGAATVKEAQYEAAHTVDTTTLPVMKDLTARMDPLETYTVGCILGGLAVNVTGTLENMQDGIESTVLMLQMVDDQPEVLGTFVMRVVLGEMQAFVDACRDAQVG